MAQLQPERLLLEEDRLQGQWSTRSEPPTPPPVSVIGGGALVVDGLPRTSSDDQPHQKKSVLKKVKDKAKKLKDSLTKSKKEGRDHENDVRSPHHEEDDEDDYYSSASDYEGSTPRTGGSVEGVTHSMSGLNAAGVQPLFAKKDPEAPRPGINWTSPESISSTGIHDPKDMRAAPGIHDPKDMRAAPGTSHLTDGVLPNSFGGLQSTANPPDTVDFRRIEIIHLTDVAAEAPTATNARVPEGIMKPVMEKSSMEAPLKTVNEGKLEADIGAPPIIRQAEAALGSPNRSGSGLGHGKYVDGEGKGYTQKIYDTAGTAKDSILSKLGYGAHKSLADENHVGSPENYTAGKSCAADDLLEEAPDGEAKGYTSKIYATPGTAKDKAAGNEKVWEEGRDGEGKGYTQKLYDMAGTAKDVISSKLGYGAHEPPFLEESHKSLTEESDVGAPEIYNTGKSYAADNFSPLHGTASSPISVTAPARRYGGQSDVQQAKPKNIVEEKHVTAIYHVVGGGGGNQAMTSSVVSADIVSHGKDSAGSECADGGESSPGGKGMVERVTEAVSSLLGMKGGEPQLSDANQADILARKAEQHVPCEFRRKEEWTLKFQN